VYHGSKEPVTVSVLFCRTHSLSVYFVLFVRQFVTLIQLHVVKLQSQLI